MNFYQDKYDHLPNRWYCEECNASVRRVEEPVHCPNCTELKEPQWAGRWRLDGRSIKVADTYNGFNNMTKETYLNFSYATPGEHNGYRDDTLYLDTTEVREGGTSSQTVAKLSPEQCGELAVMFWKLSQGLPLENLEKKFRTS